MSDSRPTPTPSPPPTAKTGGFNYAALSFRAVILILLASSLWLVWWSYNRVYAPRLRECRQDNATVNRLSAEVDDLDRRWPPEDIEKINQRSGQADASLFSDQSGVEAWLADFREQLPPMGLELTAALDKTTAHSVGGRKVAVIPATLQVEFRPVTNSPAMPSPYQRLLYLARQLTLQQTRADFIELTVDSRTNSISHAVLGLNFWAGEKEAK